MMRYLLLSTLLCISLNAYSQYNFKSTKEIKCTPIKNQAKTGTCWSFATASFIESELLKSGKGEHDLSEMFVVRNIYEDKARNYILRQGKANFSQGSLSHDLMRMMDKVGVVPDQAYSGLSKDETSHNHSEMEAGLKGFLDGILTGKSLSPKWKIAFNSILDTYLGEKPKDFMINGQRKTPQEFAKDLGISAENYLNLSSFSHHPFYKDFILEIPDNYSNGSFYNVPLNEMMEAINYALDKGYSIAWDGDVSEKGFSAKNGIAVLPTDSKREDLFTMPGQELVVNQTVRQNGFESFSTTDDHLMHIVGKAKDQKGTTYYVIKNSWGEISEFKGYLYMSEAYVQMKTISVLINKEGIPTKILSKRK